MSQQTNRRGRMALIITGAIASLLVGFTLTPTFAAIVASIQNSTNTATTGTLTMKETSGTYTCNSTDGSGSTTNTATCATINKYGGTATALVPGGTPITTTLAIQNTGSIAATGFGLTPGACTQSAVAGTSFSGSATDLCAKIKVTIKSGSVTIYDGTAADLATGGQIDLLAKLGKTSVAAGESVPLSVAVQLDASAGAAYQALQISQPLTWTFSA